MRIKQLPGCNQTRRLESNKMKIKVLNEIENSDLLRVEINKEIRIIYKSDLEKYKGVRRKK